MGLIIFFLPLGCYATANTGRAAGSGCAVLLRLLVANIEHNVNILQYISITHRHQSADYQNRTSSRKLSQSSDSRRNGILNGQNLTPFAALYACRNRLGIRLQGPRPKFARPDGGEGGSHPSNVHDHVYAIGTINFTGKLPALVNSMLHV